MRPGRSLPLAVVVAVVSTIAPGVAGAERSRTDGRATKPPVEVSGFLTVLYKLRIDEDGSSGTEPDAFRLGKSRVRVSGDLRDEVGYVVEIDPRSPTVAGVMRDAYVVLHLIPRHEIRLGQQKTPFGYENRVSSTRLYTITRSELSESLGRGVTLRDVGIGLVGDVKLGGGWRIEDAIAVVNGAGLGVQADDTTRKNVWARLGLRYKLDPADLIVRLGVSGAIGDQMGEADPGPPPEAAERFEFRRLAGDLEIDQTWGFAAVEVARGWDEIPAGSDEIERSAAWSVLIAGKSPWHVGPVFRYDTWDAEAWHRSTYGAYWGEPDARVRVLGHYERFRDQDGRHDGRVMAMTQVRF